MVWVSFIVIRSEYLEAISEFIENGALYDPRSCSRTKDLIECLFKFLWVGGDVFSLKAELYV